MKQIILLLMFMCFTLLAGAQDFYLQSSKTLSKFSYKNSNGESLDNLRAKQNYSMSAGYSAKFFAEQLKWSAGFSYSGYGSVGSIYELNDYLEWDVSYLELDMGMKYDFLTVKKASFFIQGIVSPGVLLQGTQVINNDVLDLKVVDEYSASLFNLKGGLGIDYNLSENIYLYAKYMYGKSSNIEEGDNEELKISSHNLSFGIAVKLSQNYSGLIIK